MVLCSSEFACRVTALEKSTLRFFLVEWDGVGTKRRLARKRDGTDGRESREKERARRKRIAEVEFYWPEILQKDQIVWHLKMHKSDSFDIDASLSVGSRMKDDKKEEAHINISKSQTTDLFRLNTKLTVYSQLIRNPLISPSSSLPPLLPLIQVRFIGISQSPI